MMRTLGGGFSNGHRPAPDGRAWDFIVISESEDVEISEDPRGAVVNQVLRQITDREIMTETTNQQRDWYAWDVWDGNKMSEFIKNRSEVTVAEVLHGGRRQIRAASENLKDVSLEIPRNALVVFTGVSRSGKSSLAVRDYIHSTFTIPRHAEPCYYGPTSTQVSPLENAA
jgi:hypothetical protein